MKPTIRIIKTALLCFLMFAVKNSNAQFFPTNFTTPQGSCIGLNIDSSSGFTMDTFNVLSGPFNGQFIPGANRGSWLYCPDSTFTGTDQMEAYWCISGPAFPICDTSVFTFNVLPDSVCNLSVAIQSGPCAGPLPSLMVVVTGGTPPYQYLWNNGVASDVVCNLTTGTYCVTVTDADGCSVSSCQSVGGGCQMLVSMVLDSSGCLFPSVNGGTPPFTYMWSDSSTNSDICNPNPLSPYCVTVTDAQGCIASSCNSFGCNLYGTITESDTCLTVTATGGTPPYTYVWENGSTTPTICPVAGGTYCVEIYDAVGCMDFQCGTVIGSCQFEVTLSYDSLTGCIMANPSGGNAPYIYAWSTGSPLSTVCNPTPDVYSLTITDNDGCIAVSEIIYVTPNTCAFSYDILSLAIPMVSFTALVGSDHETGTIQWNFGDGNTGVGTTALNLYFICDTFYNVSMLVYDSLGNNLCSYTELIYLNCGLDTNRFCQAHFVPYQDSTNNMQFHFVDQSVYSPVAYSWDFGDGNISTAQNPVHTFAIAGIYTVCLVVTDATGCASTVCQQVNAGNVQIQDLAAYHYHYTTVTPGFPLWANLSYCNYGTTLMNGTVEYRYPTGTTLASATPTPAAHDVAQRLLTFNFSNLLPGTCSSIAVNLNADASLPLGSAANDTMWVKPIAGDINPADNISTVSDVVIGSWDPNDKAVSPKGVGDDGEIPVNTQTLSYKIRFQNTGSAPAVNVVVRDAMDSNIDLASVQVMDASHEHITEIIGNELVVTFNNILLPDSNMNEPESHGYIQVMANLKPGLTEGTEIFNTAEIYFDFNEAVITNTVVNTLKDATGIHQIAGFDFSIMPNPAQEQILMSGKFGRDAQFEIINELGQIVLSDDVTSDKMQVNIQSLKTGIYFVKIISKDKTGVQRLLVTK